MKAPWPAAALERSTVKQTDPGATARQIMEDRRKSTSKTKQQVLEKVEATASGEFDALQASEIDQWLDSLPKHGNGNGHS